MSQNEMRNEELMHHDGYTNDRLSASNDDKYAL
jgi:hypothetical protein